MARFGSVITAMVTPFDEAGRLDAGTAASLAQWLVATGSEALVVAGTTGEAPTLTDDERLDLFAAVRDAVTVPIIAGTGTNDTAHSVHLTAEAASIGVDGILCVTPYYNRPSQAGIEAHVRAVAEAAPTLPVVIYDIPVRTGRKIANATLLRLAHDVPNVLGLKDAAGNPAETAGFISSAPEGMEVWSGDDSFTLPLLAVGAVGVIGVATHWAATDFADMVRFVADGRLAEARQVNSRLMESCAFETGDEAPNPVPTKALLRVLGRPVGACRLPMGPEPDWVEPRAREVLANLEAWRAAFPGRP